jgi:hypothetical protein
MARSLSVKIPTATLIADVEATIAKIEEDVANYPALTEKYRADLKAYNEKIVQLTIQAVKKSDLIGTDYGSPIRVTSGYRGNSVQIEVDGDALGFPEKPEAPSNPNDRTYYGRDYTTKLDLLKKNLKVLRMTNQEEVNASTYNTVMELL